MGVTIMRLNKGDKLVSVAKIIEEENNEEENNEEENSTEENSEEENSEE
jgi:hypothetical protein